MDSVRKARIAELSERIKCLSNEYVSDERSGTDELLTATLELQRVLETPERRVQKLRWQPLHHAGIVVAIQSGLLDALVTISPGNSLSAEDLAKICNSNVDFVIRIMRLLTALGVGEEVARRVYTSNEAARVLNNPANKGGVMYFNSILLPISITMPDYLKDQKMLGAPLNVTDPFGFTFGTDIWGFLQKNKKLSDNFNHSMVGNNAIQNVRWFEKYPAASLLNKGDDETLQIVDVGGGYGHDLNNFLKAYPSIGGRFVLQDVAHTLNEVKAQDSRMECMPHNIFDKQPLAGAKIYYLHNICHDWSDEDCVKILSRISSAMDKSNSTLIIDDIVLKDMGENLDNADLDILVMLLFGGRERSFFDWQKLIAGITPPLRIANVWASKSDFQTILEVKVDDRNISPSSSFVDDFC